MYVILSVCLFTHIHFCDGLEVSAETYVETCILEDFNAKCGYDEVIAIVGASFGHIRLGRCIKRDLGFFGCLADVTGLLTLHCNGKRSCTVPVEDVASTITLECSQGLSVYLGATYTCIKGVLISSTCDTLEASSAEIYFLTTSIFTERCSTRGYITLVVDESQHVETTLIDLSMNASSTSIQNIRIVDDGIEHTFERHRGATTKPHWGYVSTSSHITLIFKKQTPIAIITYKAVGCVDFNIPSDSYVEKVGQDLTVKCYNTEQSWNLKCIGTRWLGSIGNCISPTEIVIGIIVTATLMMCCIVFGIGLACTKGMKRKYLPNKDYEKCEMVEVDGTIARMLKTDNVQTWQNTMNPTMSSNDHAPVVAMDRDLITVNTNIL
ncbi:hypothetical protein CAPTEDRAFT_211537 [Capitella teleta]|uniref:SUEL-type lectin domain-containing protein n=1 Tax=Capitella teleta TaxID=283909 RepID=R7TAG7_CAPTE|nr:hypothetical protein CAPTEDRAFT_211537 [Capitella teleta]|eukprot:ELT90699.1 hypothetical protein CAPTEDRAFT_211537 [Capitella teleta]